MTEFINGAIMKPIYVNSQLMQYFGSR